MSNATTDTIQDAGITMSDGENLNAILQITTWILLALTSLLMCFRFLTRYFLRKHDILHSWDDILLLIAYILAVGEMIIWILPQTSIFGNQQQTSLDSNSPQAREAIESALKAMYAGDLLLISSLGLAKISVCACYLRLIPGNDIFHRRWSLITAGIIILWTVAFTLAAAFRCGVEPWWRKVYSSYEGTICVDQNAFLSSTGITNILTDVGLVAIPISLVGPMSLPLRTRLATILVFSARALIIIPCAFQLVYISTTRGGDEWARLLLLRQDDGASRIAKYIIATQAVQFAGISATCIIYLAPLLQSLGSGRQHAMATTLSAKVMGENGHGLAPKKTRSTQEFLMSSGESGVV